MGRGIAVAFAYAGHDVTIVDFKPRDDSAFAKLAAEAHGEVRETLAHASQASACSTSRGRRHRGARDGRAGSRSGSRVQIRRDHLRGRAGGARSQARGARARLGARRPEPIIASTTSTILVDDLSGAVAHPERFLNAHWLNPAYLVPLVELSPGARTDPAVVARLKAMLEGIGKVPVVCAATPGYIVPRIQALAMNEAARMVEEGVASAEDIDKAIKYGFGFRFAVLGMLEFIDWGGGDILYYASRYLTEALGNDRYRRARRSSSATCARTDRPADGEGISRLRELGHRGVSPRAAEGVRGAASEYGAGKAAGVA